MKLCPLGHENPDDATRCAVCLRRFSAAPATLELTGLPVVAVTVEPGRMTAVPAELRQHGGEPADYHVEVTGDAASWAEPAPARVTVHPGGVSRLVLAVRPPAGAPPDRAVLTVTARGTEDGSPSARADVVLQVAGAPAGTAARRDGPAPTVPPRGRTHQDGRSADVPDPAQTATLTGLPGTGEPGGTTDPPDPSGGGGQDDRRRSPVSRSHVSRLYGRRRARPGVLAVVAVVVVAAVALLVGLVDGVLDGLRGGGATPEPDPVRLTAEEALALPRDEAHAVLDDLRTRDQARVDELLGAPGWLVQLSGKCAAYESVDLLGAEGVGAPDGVEEAYPGGVGEAGILAFHVASQARWGDTVVLTDTGRLGRDACADGRPLWLTLDAPGGTPLDTVGAALCECRSRGLPFRECGAIPTDGADPVFWIEENAALACA